MTIGVNLYPDLSFVPHLYLCQRLAVLQESCKKTQQPMNFFKSQIFKFDYTENQWWILKYALFIISNQKYLITVAALHFPLTS
jgi:hypothetical protein